MSDQKRAHKNTKYVNELELIATFVVNRPG